VSKINQNNQTLLDFINYQTVEEYKIRLLQEQVLSPRSINRKLSAIKKYFLWIKTYKQNDIFNASSPQPLLSTGQGGFKFLQDSYSLIGEFLFRPYLKANKQIAFDSDKNILNFPQSVWFKN